MFYGCQRAQQKMRLNKRRAKKAGSRRTIKKLHIIKKAAMQAAKFARAETQIHENVCDHKITSSAP
jgi:hypothetical protein